MHLDQDSKWVRPDARKGTIAVTISSEDQLIHFSWKDRTTGKVELDLILFPDDASFRRVPECTTGRVYVLEFKTGTKHFFWMQDLSSDKDEERCNNINTHLGATVSHSTSSKSSSSKSESTTKSTTSAPSSSTATSTSAPSSSTPTSLTSRLEAFMQTNGPAPRLNDVLNTQEILATGILNDESIKAELQTFLPASEVDSVENTIRCPQFRQAVDLLEAAIKSGPDAFNSVLASFGLTHPSKGGSSRIETFLTALNEAAAKKQTENKDKMDE